MHFTPYTFPLLTSHRVGVGLALALLIGLACPARATGSWTPLSNLAPDAIGTTLLLTDGSVMAQGTTGAGSGSSAHWYKLTPDSHGNYANGTWTKLADMHHERLYYASAVLRDGRVFIAGGEYTEAGYVDTNTAEIYDPVKNAWTQIAAPAGWANIGDAPTKTLADGTVLLGRINGYETALYNPVANTWAAGGNTLGGCDEASWALLPDQSILTVDINSSPKAEKYLPSSNTWVTAGQTAVGLVADNEIGPAVLLPSGKCLYVGATGHTALYSLPSGAVGPGTWAAGPDFPTDGSGNQLEAKDAPGCLLTNGKVLCVVAPHGSSDGGYPYGQQFFEYTPDPSGLTGGSLAPAPDSGLNSANTPAFTGRMLALPSGQMLYSNFSFLLSVYTPDSGPNPAWKPIISGVAGQADGSYRVSGTQFNGLSEGASYGDDASESTNYPLVRLTSGAGVVTYARTFNHSTMAVATGGLPVATSFTLPAGLAPGAYQLQVVANGISSDPVRFTVSATAFFVGADAATRGNWKGLYGADGYSLSQDTSANNPRLPPYATVGLSGNANYTWAATTADGRALLKAAPNATDRLAACWYGGAFDVDVNLTDGQAHRVSLYALDWDRRGRIDAVTVKDAATGAVLDTQTAGAAATGGGVYLTWAVKGHVVFHVTCGNPPGNFNAVLSALFFDAVAPASAVPAAPANLKATAGNAQISLTWNASANAASYNLYRASAAGAETLLKSGLTATSYTDAALTNGTAYFYQVTAVNAAGESAKSAEATATPAPPVGASASFVGADAATRGNWKGLYGADGYSLSQDPSANNPALPAYASVRLSGNGNYTWAATTADVHAPLKAAPGTTDRLAACWYGGAFDVDVNLTDGQAHRVSLYALDWDGRGRIDAVTVKDAATGAVLDTQTAGAAATGGGVYLTWAVKGHVVFHVTCGNPPGNFNAVLSALFFDPSK